MGAEDDIMMDVAVGVGDACVSGFASGAFGSPAATDARRRMFGIGGSLAERNGEAGLEEEVGAGVGEGEGVEVRVELIAEEVTFCAVDVRSL